MMSSAETRPERLTEGNPAVAVTAVCLMFLIIATLYVIPLFVTDPSLRWAAEDEVCCHVPTIRAIAREGLPAALTDYKHYRSATAPLYHMLMSVALDRVDPVVLRFAWVIVTLAVGAVLYHHVRTDVTLLRAERAAVALAVTFLLSPTVRASALYFITDGLAVHLAIVALVLLRRARAGPVFSTPLGILAVVVAYASFYTRQYFLWATLFVTYSVVADAPTTREKLATFGAFCLLTVPAVGLVRVWHGFTPPLGFSVHTEPALSSTVPNALGLLTVYSLPILWMAVRDSARDLGLTMTARSLSRPFLAICGMVMYVAAGLAMGIEVPQAGGILRVARLFGPFGDVVFLVVSSLGLLLLLRWLVVDGPSQLWWGVFLLPLFAGSILLQRYFEPAIVVVMFLAARPSDAVKVLDSRLVWFYPFFAVVYALSRAIFIAPNV